MGVSAAAAQTEGGQPSSTPAAARVTGEQKRLDLKNLERRAMRNRHERRCVSPSHAQTIFVQCMPASVLDSPSHAMRFSVHDFA